MVFKFNFREFKRRYKKSAWLNTIEHLKGNHNDCLIHKYTVFVWDIGNQYDAEAKTTNFNESFHLEQLKFGIKNIVFPKSQVIRDQLSVPHHNEGPQFALELREMLELPKLHQENEIKLKRNNDIRQDMFEKRKSFEYRQKEKTYRRERKAKNKKNKKEDYRSSSDSDSY